MTHMDLKLYEFVKKLRKTADTLDGHGDDEESEIARFFYSKAEAYREVAEMIEMEFRD